MPLNEDLAKDEGKDPPYKWWKFCNPAQEAKGLRERLTRSSPTQPRTLGVPPAAQQGSCAGWGGRQDLCVGPVLGTGNPLWTDCSQDAEVGGHLQQTPAPDSTLPDGETWDFAGLRRPEYSFSMLEQMKPMESDVRANSASDVQASIDTPYPPDASGPGNLLAPDDVGERKLVSCTVADARNAGGSALCRYNDSSDIAPPHLCSTPLSPLTLSPIHIFLRTLVRLRTRRCRSQWFGGLTSACRCTGVGLRCPHRVDSAIIQISLLAWITLQLSSPGLNTTTSNLDGMVSPRW